MYEALKSMKVCKSPGPEQVHPRVLRELARELTFPLTELFNRTIEEGSLPKQWKEAEVRLILKKGSHKVPGNYRPVSLTSIICKLFECLSRDKLFDHMVFSGILSRDQFGFCKGRSCVTQPLVTLHKL